MKLNSIELSNIEFLLGNGPQVPAVDLSGASHYTNNYTSYFRHSLNVLVENSCEITQYVPNLQVDNVNAFSADLTHIFYSLSHYGMLVF